VRDLIADNPLSFLRVTRAEADLPQGADSANEAFCESPENLESLIRKGILDTDPEEALYIYRLATDDHTQTGIVACFSLEEYEEGLIKKHENVRPEKVEDRTRHMLAVGAQTGLIFLAFRNTATIRSLIAEAITGQPLYDFVCPEVVKQKVWRIGDTAPWVEAFGKSRPFISPTAITGPKARTLHERNFAIRVWFTPVPRITTSSSRACFRRGPADNGLQSGNKRP